MAVSTNDLLINISADTKAAVSGLKDVSDNLSKLQSSASGTESALSGFGFAAVKLHESLALAKEGFEALSKVWDATVGKFREAQDGITRLSGSLSLMGEKDVKGATDQMVKFAEQMEDVSVVSKDQAINLLSVAKAAGQTNEASEKLVKTAADLAAATGEDVNSAFQGLLSTLKGNARGVGEMSVFLRNLTQDELKAGKGVDALAARLKGFSQVQAQTFGGAAKMTANKVQEIFIEIGGIISKGLNLDSTGQRMLNFVDSVLKKINELKPALTNALVAVRGVFDGFVAAISGIDFQGLAKEGVLFASVVGTALAVDLLPVLIPLAGTIAGIAAGFIAAAAPILATVAAITALGLAVDILYRNMNRLPELGKSFYDAWQIAINKIEELFLNMVKNILGLTAAVIDQLGNLIPGLSDLADKANMSISGSMDTLDKKMQDIGESSTNLFQKLADDSKDIDFGLAGKLKEQLSNIVSNFKTAFGQAKASAGGGPNPDQLPKGAPPQEQFRSKFKLFGDDDLKEVKNAFGPGVANFGSDVGDLTSGLLSFAGSADIMLSAAQKLVDLIPGLIDKATNLINSVTDLPMKIATSVQNLGDALIKFANNFIPNLFKAVEKLGDVFVNFITKFPDAIAAMFQKLPELFNHLIDKLPQWLPKLINAYITYIPKVAIAMVTWWVKGMPQVAKEFIRVVYEELPPIIVKAVIDSLKDVVNMIFNGLGNLSFNTDQLTNGIKQISKTLTDQSSKLFQVVDASAAAHGQNAAQAIADAIESATNRAIALLKMLWAALKAIWQWVYDKIMTPIINAIKAVWQWVYDNVLSPFLTVLQAAWMLIWNNYLNPLLTGIQTIFNWVYNTVFVPFYGIVTSAFNWVASNIIGPLNSFAAKFSSIVDSLHGNIGWVNSFSGAVNQLFNTPGWIGQLQDVANKLGGLSFGGIGGGGGGGGGFFGQASSAVSSATGGFLASGGMVYAAQGMFVPRGTDTVPSMLTPGEYVINRRAVSALGVGAMQQINQGQLPKSGPTNIDLHVNIDHHGELDDKTVRTKIIPEMLKQLKKASTEGRFLMSDRGLRNV